MVEKLICVVYLLVAVEFLEIVDVGIKEEAVKIIKVLNATRIETERTEWRENKYTKHDRK